MFKYTTPQLSTFAAAKRLKQRFDPRREDSPDKILGTLRDLVAAHEQTDERYMMWLAEHIEEMCLLRYVECEAEIAHFAALKYDEQEAEHRAELGRIEQEWRIAATLAAYFKAVHVENSSKGIAEFLNRKYPKPAKEGKK